jgi:diguanylate cyclase (GGDEF)-like protein
VPHVLPMSIRMNLSESPRAAARFAAVVLVVGGLAGLVTNHQMVHRGGWNDVLSVVNVAIGITAWILPWQRWPAWATVVLAPIGLTLIGVSRGLGAEPSASFVASFVMVFMWVGLTQPPRTSFFLSGPAILAYIVPIALSAHHDATELQSLAIVLPVLVASAEVPARMVAELRRARAAEHEYALRCADDARTDQLTGLGNRRFGERLLGELMPGDGVLLLDLDHFKAVNDTFGHAGGDRVLRDLGDYLKGALRDDDAVARFGGEEFLIVVRRGGPEAIEVAERITRGWRDQHPLATFSMGVSVHDATRPVSATFSQADTALYRAKQNGRDQVRLFGAEPTSEQVTSGS